MYVCITGLLMPRLMLRKRPGNGGRHVVMDAPESRNVGEQTLERWASRASRGRCARDTGSASQSATSNVRCKGRVVSREVLPRPPGSSAAGNMRSDEQGLQPGVVHTRGVLENSRSTRNTGWWCEARRGNMGLWKSVVAVQISWVELFVRHLKACSVAGCCMDRSCLTTSLCGLGGAQCSARHRVCRRIDSAAHSNMPLSARLTVVIVMWSILFV